MWIDDYADIQQIYVRLETTEAGEILNPSIFDSTLWDLHQQYRDWVLGSEKSPPALIKNWHPEDLTAYVGGPYVK